MARKISEIEFHYRRFWLRDLPSTLIVIGVNELRAFWLAVFLYMFVCSKLFLFSYGLFLCLIVFN
jgi:hypothetical protein